MLSLIDKVMRHSGLLKVTLLKRSLLKYNTVQKCIRPGKRGSCLKNNEMAAVTFNAVTCNAVFLAFRFNAYAHSSK